MLKGGLELKVITVTKEFAFDMAHMLAEHDGLCKNIHGHTYKLLITLSRGSGLIDDGPAEGMIMDFKQLKELVGEKIVAPFDHALMVNVNSKSLLEQKLYDLFRNHADLQKVYWVDYRPTAENMADHIFEKAGFLLRRFGVNVERVRLYETPTSYVEVYAE